MTDETLQEAINWLNTSAPKTNIKGRDYTQVATRVEAFRRFFGTHYGITTELLPVEAENLVRVRATIANGDGAVLATGMAEEDRRAGSINKTSALENCETSAIGRALAALGLHGGEFATANEVEGARAQESAQKQAPKQSAEGVSEQFISDTCESLRSCTSLEALQKTWAGFYKQNHKFLTDQQYKQAEQAKDQRKHELNQQPMDPA